MGVVILALMLVWQGSALLEHGTENDVMVNIPVVIGGHDSLGRQTMESIAGLTSLDAIKNKGVVRQHYDYSCGSAALTTLLVYFLGLEVDEQRVMNGLLTYGQKEKIIARRGFSLADMKRFVSAIGYKSGGFKAEFSDLEELTQPAILRIVHGDFTHFVVLRDIVAERVFIADPAFGNLTLTKEAFLNVWDNILFLVYADEGQRKSGLELTDEDLAFIGEDESSQLLLQRIPAYYHQHDRDVSSAARDRLSFKP